MSEELNLQLQPATGAYTKYLGLPQPSDARPDGMGNIWWTDWNTTLGRINVHTESVTTWQTTPRLGGLAMDGAGRLWLATYPNTRPRNGSRARSPQPPVRSGLPPSNQRLLVSPWLADLSGR